MTGMSTSVQQGREAIRERNFSTAIQLLRRAYRQEPSADNALWLASAYTEAGYSQLASLYREIYQEKTGKAPDLVLSAKPSPAPTPLQPEQPAPPTPQSQQSTLPLPLPRRRPSPLPPPLPKPAPLPQSRRVTWNYTPTPIDPNSLTQVPVGPEPATPPAEPSDPATPYRPVRHAPDLSQPQRGTPLSRRMDALHRQFLDRATPHIAEIALQLAEAYDEQDNYREAQRFYREVLDLDRTLTLRPMVLERLEEIRALQAQGGSPSVHRLLEMADQHRELDNLETAEALYRQLLRSDAPLEVHNAARKGLIRLYPDGQA